MVTLSRNILTCDYAVLPATTRLSTCEMSQSALLLQSHSITALWPVLISCSAEGRGGASWRRWLGKDTGVVYPPKTVTHPSANWVPRVIETRALRPTTPHLEWCGMATGRRRRRRTMARTSLAMLCMASCYRK